MHLVFLLRVALKALYIPPKKKRFEKKKKESSPVEQKLRDVL